MDGPHFDAWTRRRFGCAVGGGAASLLGLAAIDHAEAKKKHKHKHKKKCRKKRQGCGSKKKCCKGLSCGETAFEGPNHCCKPSQSVCTVAEECCGDFVCTAIFGLDGTRCCSFFGACTEELDCCVGLHCIDNLCA